MITVILTPPAGLWYNPAMKGMMAIAMVAVVYVLYVLLGAYKQFPIAING